MKLLNEDFFDDEEVQSEVQSSVDVNEEDTDFYSHTLKYFCCICLDMDVFDSFFDLFIKMIHKYLDYSSFIVSYDVKLIYRNVEYDLTKEHKTDITSVIDYDEDCIIQIRFNSTKNCNFNRFVRDMSLLSNLIEELSKNCYVEISLDDESIMSEYDEVDKYSYHVAFYKMYSMIFRKCLSKVEMNLHYNGGVKLSEKSEKRINEFAVGDKLYSTSSGELVSQEETDGKKNIKIGVCVIPTALSHDNSARFSCVNRYPSLTTPDNGNIYLQNMHFGTLKDLTESHGDNGDIFYYGGEEGTKILYKYLNQYGCDRNWKSGRLTNSYETGYCPPALAIWRFRTMGTKRGDWYLPSCSELMSMGRNKVAMKKGFGIAYPIVGTVWTCVEQSRTHQRSVILSRPIVNTATTKDSKQKVIAFLKVTD